MTDREAKQYLRDLYLQKGYKVSKVTRLKECGFSVAFRKKRNGKEGGPYGLPSIHCNYPGGSNEVS